MNRAFFEQLSAAARDVIAREIAAGLVGENKALAGFDPVTAADRAAERELRALIERAYPDHGISGEEFPTVRPDARLRWSLDPVDGTRALLCGLPSWAILVGLIEDGHHIAGMIDLPAIDETLIAVDGTTWRNGAPVRTTASYSPSNSSIVTPSPTATLPTKRTPSVSATLS